MRSLRSPQHQWQFHASRCWIESNLSNLDAPCPITICAIWSHTDPLRCLRYAITNRWDGGHVPAHVPARISFLTVPPLNRLVVICLALKWLEGTTLAWGVKPQSVFCRSFPLIHSVAIIYLCDSHLLVVFYLQAFSGLVLTRYFANHPGTSHQLTALSIYN